jgi:hypothetical protein
VGALRGLDEQFPRPRPSEAPERAWKESSWADAILAGWLELAIQMESATRVVPASIPNALPNVGSS